MRLNKYLGESGACSRREADALIREGRVTLNGVTAELGMQVAEGDEVRLDGEIVGAARKLERPVYIALNKPVGITCTTDRRVEGNIVDFVDHPERIFMIGRLDKSSEGLILLTNDGDIVNEVLRAAHGHEKEYLVTVDREVTDDFVRRMAGGVDIGDATTRPCKVKKTGPREIDIILTQGLNRQIRRMCEALGHHVVRLQRIRVMHIHLGKLKRGRWRNLTPDEVQKLMPPPERRKAGR
jgi:23S rRNA pseudouridine2604 synthase